MKMEYWNIMNWFQTNFIPIGFEYAYAENDAYAKILTLR